MCVGIKYIYDNVKILITVHIDKNNTIKINGQKLYNT